MKYILFFLFPILGYSQPNCNAYLYKKDTLQYNACKSVENMPFYQYSRRYQERFDNALKICPYFAYAYKAKATAYLKSGDFITWKYLIDKAVEHDTLSYIGYRGWCKYQFFRDYEGAIADIEFIERRSGILNIGNSAGGEYHLTVAKSICYSALGNKIKAIEVLENLISTKNYNIGLFDYYQLGVTYFQINDFENALKYFDKQITVNDIAENRFFKAKIAKIKNDKILFENEKNEAIRLYKDKKILFDHYTEHFNKVYFSTIINETYN